MKHTPREMCTTVHTRGERNFVTESYSTCRRSKKQEPISMYKPLNEKDDILLLLSSQATQYGVSSIYTGAGTDLYSLG